MIRALPAPSDRLASTNSLAQRQHVAAHEPGHVGPGEERDDHDHQPQPRLQRPVEALAGRRAGHDADREQQQRDREDDVARPGDQPVDPAAEVARRHPQHDADEHRDAGRDDADQQRHARPVDRAHEDVAAAVVGAEPEVGVRPSGMPKMSVVSRWKSSFGPWPVSAANAGARIAISTISPMKTSPARAKRSCLKRAQKSCQGERPTMTRPAARRRSARGAGGLGGRRAHGRGLGVR